MVIFSAFLRSDIVPTAIIEHLINVRKLLGGKQLPLQEITQIEMIKHCRHARIHNCLVLKQ